MGSGFADHSQQGIFGETAFGFRIAAANGLAIKQAHDAMHDVELKGAEFRSQ